MHDFYKTLIIMLLNDTNTRGREGRKGSKQKREIQD